MQIGVVRKPQVVVAQDLQHGDAANTLTLLPSQPNADAIFFAELAIRIDSRAMLFIRRHRVVVRQ